jgi:penicillin-binding protein 2
MKIRFRRKRRHIPELHPHEILLDVNNLPQFDQQQFEGRIQKPIAQQSLHRLLYVMIAVAVLFIVRLVVVQLIQHDTYQKRSERNSLDHIPVFADRGVIYDRKGVELAWNGIRVSADDHDSVIDAATSAGTVVTRREYIAHEGFGSLLGYVSYPAKDTNGNLWQHRVFGKDGVEKEFDTVLAGMNGTKIVETNVSRKIISESIIETPDQGQNLSLSINSDIQQALYGGIKTLAQKSGYVGGAGAIMDIRTGGGDYERSV